MKATNERAWALGGKVKNGQFRIRRVVWSLTLAREERRDGEIILPVIISIWDDRPRR